MALLPVWPMWLLGFCAMFFKEKRRKKEKLKGWGGSYNGGGLKPLRMVLYTKASSTEWYFGEVSIVKLLCPSRGRDGRTTFLELWEETKWSPGNMMRSLFWFGSAHVNAWNNNEYQEKTMHTRKCKSSERQSDCQYCWGNVQDILNIRHDKVGLIRSVENDDGEY